MKQSLKCRICNSGTVFLAFPTLNLHGNNLQSKDLFNLYYCSHCHSFFMPPVEKQPNFYQKYYQENYYPASSQFLKLLNNFSFKQKFNLITKNIVPHQLTSILDIGCGQGEFLDSLPSSVNKYGVEINPHAIEILKNKHIKVFTKDINQINFGHQKFDCITLFHVFEHLPDPQTSLFKIHELLAKGGILLMVTPNSQSLGFKLGKQKYFHLDSPRHLYLPSKHSLKFLLTKSRFTNIKFIYPFYDYPLDLFWSLRHSWLKYFIYPLYPLFKFFSQETILTIAIKK